MQGVDMTSVHAFSKGEDSNNGKNNHERNNYYGSTEW